jgi:hypothetical protein
MIGCRPGSRPACAAFALASLLLAITGCSGDARDSFNVNIVNDLGHPVVVGLCKGLGCKDSYEHVQVRTGDKVGENVQGGVSETFAIVDGSVRRCLNVAGSSPTNARFLASSATSCDLHHHY